MNNSVLLFLLGLMAEMTCMCLRNDKSIHRISLVLGLY